MAVRPADTASDSSPHPRSRLGPLHRTALLCSRAARALPRRASAPRALALPDRAAADCSRAEPAELRRRHPQRLGVQHTQARSPSAARPLLLRLQSVPSGSESCGANRSPAAQARARAWPARGHARVPIIILSSRVMGAHCTVPARAQPFAARLAWPGRLGTRNPTPGPVRAGHGGPTVTGSTPSQAYWAQAALCPGQPHIGCRPKYRDRSSTHYRPGPGRRSGRGVAAATRLP